MSSGLTMRVQPPEEKPAASASQTQPISGATGTPVPAAAVAPAVASVSNAVVIPAGSTTGGVNIFNRTINYIGAFTQEYFFESSNFVYFGTVSSSYGCLVQSPSYQAWPDPATCRREVFRWVTRYNTRRRHSWCGQQAPIIYEQQHVATLPLVA